MNAARRFFAFILLVSGFFLTAAAPAPRGEAPVALVTNITAELKPGVYNTWTLQRSDAGGGYIVEVSPKEPPVGGNYVETALVRSEFQRGRWKDVLRVKLPEGMGALKANLRVYQADHLPVVMDFETRLEPGVWHGWIIAPRDAERAYLVDVTPLEASTHGAYFETSRVQSEWNGETWFDVLRLQLPVEQPSLLVRVQVYELTGQPAALDITTWLEPGDWPGWVVAPCKEKGGYLMKVTQVDPPVEGSFLGKTVIQPEHDTRAWNDVLRLSVGPGSGRMQVRVRVYPVAEKKTGPKVIASGPATR